MIIASLRGTLTERNEGSVIIEVAGVGYRVTVSPSTVVKLGELGQEVFVQVHHHIRDDAQSLFGFLSRDERQTFEALISAHGVGPSLGLAILSVHEPVSLVRILADDDVAALCLVPGVGKKTAARLLVELKSKLDAGDIATVVSNPGVANAPHSATADVQQALSELGYTPDEIRSALSDIPADVDSSQLLKHALRALASR
jgi:Holliday junction DNA helicase RuvA